MCLTAREKDLPDRGMGRDMEEKYCCYRRRTNYYETDQMGIIHHSNYIRYFEEARLYWMEETGISYREIEEMGLLVPVLFVDCQYKSPVRYGDEITVAVRLDSFNGLKMEFSYEIYREGMVELCTAGRSGHCFLDRSMKPVRLKRDYPELFRIMTGALERGKGNIQDAKKGCNGQ